MKISLPKVVPIRSGIVRSEGWPAKADAAAWRGPLGEFAQTIEPLTEADPHAILVSALTGIGNIFGRRIFWTAGSDEHFSNLFTMIVGRTAIGRKGQSWNEAAHQIDLVDTTWPTPARGLTTGEGLVGLVRDDSMETKPIKAKGEKPTTVPVTPGIKDKRKLVVETEFGRCLRAMTRQGNTLMNVVNQAWDGDDLGVSTRKDALHATDPHISIIAHITMQEFTELLSRSNNVPIWNGFANRWLWTCAQSTRDIPSPIDFSVTAEAAHIRTDLKRAVSWVDHMAGKKRAFRMLRSRQARQWWDEELYADLKHGRPDNLFGAATNRAPAMVMRLAMIYAALARSKQIQRTHLESGLALWRYCEASARYIFTLHDPGTVGRRTRILVDALRHAADQGLTRTQIFRDVFEKNVEREAIDLVLKQLRDAGIVRGAEERSASGAGRPIERWWLVNLKASLSAGDL